MLDSADSGTWIAVGAIGLIVLAIVISLIVWLLARKRSDSQAIATPVPIPEVAPLPSKVDSSVPVRLARSTSQLATQQIDILEQMENIATDPDLLFYVFRVRHLTARINHEAELQQILNGQVLRGTDKAGRMASDVARSGMEAVADFENIRLEIKKDSVIAARATSGIANLLTQLLDRAVEAERFGKVHLVVNELGGQAVFEITDHGPGMTDEVTAQVTREMEAGLAGRRIEMTSGSLWPVGAVLGDLEAEINLTTESSGGGTVATLTASLASMGRLEDVAEKSKFGSTAVGSGGLPLPNVPQGAFSENSVVNRFMSANRAKRTPAKQFPPAGTAAEEDLSLTVPPLYKKAMERMERRTATGEISAARVRHSNSNQAPLPAVSKWSTAAGRLLDKQS